MDFRNGRTLQICKNARKLNATFLKRRMEIVQELERSKFATLLASYHLHTKEQEKEIYDLKQSLQERQSFCQIHHMELRLKWQMKLVFFICFMKPKNEELWQKPK
nr:uncharacterized protein LOC128702599 isoform X1 [Cherax quadricarinatus]